MYKNNNQKIVATIEARMASSRLPGKVLLPLSGKPALERLVERLKRSQYLDGIVVATTSNDADNSIEALAKTMGVGCFRGSEGDVLGRVLAAARAYGADIIVEITGDCPLVDPDLVDRGIAEFFENGADYAANIIPVSFPIGFDVQVFSTAVLAEVDTLTNNFLDRTHVSYYIYNHPKKYKLHSWQADGVCHWPDLRVTLDERADYELLNIIFEKLLPQNKNFSVLDVVKLLKAEPKLLEINKYVRQKDIKEG